MNIAQVILQLKVLGVKSPQDFPYLSSPLPESIRKSLELLYLLGALKPDQDLSIHGTKIAMLPLDPIFAHMLLKSEEFKCVSEMLTAVSMLSTENVFIQPNRDIEKIAAGQCHKRFASNYGDLPTLVNIYDSWLRANQDVNWTKVNYLSLRSLKHAFSVRKQLSELLLHKDIDIDVNITSMPDKEPFLRCVTAGLFLNVAKKSSDVDITSNNKSIKNKLISKSHRDDIAPYKTLIGQQPVYIHPSSVLFSSSFSSNNSEIKNKSNKKAKFLPNCVIYAELLTTSKQYMRFDS